MRNLRIVAAVLASAVLLGPAGARPLPPLPPQGPSSLLFVRFTGPAGIRATFYQGRPAGRAFDAPVVVGLRPGYIYRVQLSGFPGRPDLALYPTVEVRGVLNLSPRVNLSAYPAPVALTDDDVKAALAGSLVTKVVYLEHPDRAAPVTVRGDQVIEGDVPPDRDVLAEARELGRPVIVLRFGERVPPPEELAASSVPGTILFPGEHVLAPPRLPPMLPWACWQWYDTFIGPKPSEEECLHDGGDRGEPAGIGADGRLHGLDPEDTVAEYTDPEGRRRVVSSNRVCLCTPRFAVLRHECPLGRYEGVIATTDRSGLLTQAQLRLKTGLLQSQQVDVLKAIQGREKPSGTMNSQTTGGLVRVEVLEAEQLRVGPALVIGEAAVRNLTEIERLRLVRQMELAKALTETVKVGGVEQVVATGAVARVEGGAEVVSGELETRDLTVACNEAPQPLPPDKPLALYKWADRQAAQAGDIVTFNLKYSNRGGRALVDVAVSDSLATRLEYIPGSAQSDRPAVFTTQENEAGSLVVRWEISGKLPPGQSGVLRFQARVR